MKSKLAALILGVAAIAFSTSANAVSLVTNGGFETGDFTGWTTHNLTLFDSVCGGVCPHSGSFGAAFGAPTADSGISQDIVTIPATTYVVSFFLWNRDLGGAVDNDLSISFAGTTLLSGTNVAPFSYTLFTYDVAAVSTLSTLAFSFRNSTSWFYIDDVSVEAAPTPLPAALPLFATGLGALGLLGWRRRRKA